MKKSLMLVGALMMSTFIFAQKDAAPQEHRGDRGETMKTVLSLDDAQQSSIQEINKKYREKGREMGKDLNKQRQNEISKVLTPEQNKKWDAYKKERADKFAKARDERIKNRLDLTDDQLKTLKSTLSEDQFNRLAGRGGYRHGGHHGRHGKK